MYIKVAPGFEFMTNLSESLREHINDKLHNDPKWKNIKVILSDTNVPGEGEYKIMSYIRDNKKLPGYNKENAGSHCVFGSDTDLIMLALATEEVNFSIMRNFVSKTDMIGDAIGNYRQRIYQFLHLFKLRECLKIEIFTISNSNIENNDLKRRIDDFICMCLFLGNKVVIKYIEGLCWIMEYYHKKVPSWKWYYPYHYAPFASDLKDFGDYNVLFELGCEFKPFTQMLAVTPPAYSHFLPEEYRKLIVNPDSSIKDFYPTDFEIDMNGERYISQGIIKLPFVDEERLLTEVAKVEDSLTYEEKLRNLVLFPFLLPFEN